MDLKVALARLDPANEDHWTANGAPRMEVVHELTGDESITRKQVTDAAPDLTRDKAKDAAAMQRDTHVPDEAADPSEDQPHPQPEDHSEDEVEAEEQPQATNRLDELEAAAQSQTQVEPADISVEDLMAMPLHEIFRSYPLTVRYSQAISDICAELTRQATEAQEKLKVWSRRSEAVDRVIVKMERQIPKANPIKAYLEQQSAMRADRAARAKAFIAAGTTAEEVVKELSGKAPIDAALNKRKPARGSTRPAMGMPVRR